MSEVLKVTTLRVRHGERLALNDVSFTLTAGRITALIGANGCGKTTLLRALTRNIESDGQIEWFGRALRDRTPRDLAKQVAILPQNPMFEPGDHVMDVLNLGRIAHQRWLGLETRQDMNAVHHAADDLSLTEFLDRPMETLSGGQRQRVFLGRALAQEPRVLLLDEPATFLDLRHQVQLYRLLSAIAAARNVAILMASHDLNLTVTHADEAIILKEGVALAQGNAREIMTDAILSDAFDVQMVRHDLDRSIAFAVRSENQ